MPQPSFLSMTGVARPPDRPHIFPRRHNLNPSGAVEGIAPNVSRTLIVVVHIVAVRPVKDDTMKKAKVTALAACLTLVACAGCLPATKVIKNPDDCDTGIRYYRPKPYLLIKPMINSKTGEPVNGYVTLEEAIMPDFSEEYSIHVRSGLGTNDTSITLKDGWRLETLNVDLDSQFDDNLRAIADVASVIPRLTASDGGVSDKTPVKATNVPIGYYESVISKGCDGKKRMYGFRYVGFMPYHPCPIESCGVDVTHCQNGLTIYGLVMEADDQGGSAMVFKPLTDIPDQDAVVTHGLPRLDAATLPLPGNDDDPQSEFEGSLSSASDLEEVVLP